MLRFVGATDNTPCNESGLMYVYLSRIGRHRSAHGRYYTIPMMRPTVAGLINPMHQILMEERRYDDNGTSVVPSDEWMAEGYGLINASSLPE